MKENLNFKQFSDFTVQRKNIYWWVGVNSILGAYTFGNFELELCAAKQVIAGVHDSYVLVF